MAGEVDRLSGKLGLDTTDFKTAVRAADREIRVLQSSFKASAASLVDWTKDATGLESRVKTLTSQIDIQKLKVAALAAEHQRLAQENGENSIAAQEAEIKLNKETESLNKMQTELTGTEEELQNMREGTDEAGESVEEMGEKAEESGSKVDNLKGALSGMSAVAGAAVAAVAALGAAAVGAVGAIGALVFKASDAAGELVDMSLQTGISTTRLQELQFVGDQVGTSLDTITGSQARLIRSMGSAQDQVKKYNDELASGKKPEDLQLGEMADAFKTIGVSVTDANGNLRDSQDVFSNVIDALGRIQNPAERDALAMQLFGKSAQELNPLIKAGSAELARLSQEAHNVGAVMSEEDVAALEAFGDTTAAIQAGVKGLLGTLAVQFLPAFQEVATALQDLFKSEEFKKRVEEISKVVAGMVKTITTAIGQLVKGDTKGALTTLFGADKATQLLNFFNQVKKFLDALISFVTTHGQAIKTILVALVAGFAAFSIIGTVVVWVSGLIATISGLAAAFTAAGGGIAGIVAILGGPVTVVVAAVAAAIALLTAAWVNNWGGIRDIVTQVWTESIQPILGQLIEWLSTNIPIAIQALSTFWTETLLPAIQTVWTFLSENVFPLLQAIAGFIIDVFVANLKNLADMWQNTLLPAMQLVWKFLEDTLFPLLQAIGNFIGAVFNLALRIMAGLWQNILLPALQAVWKVFNDDILPILQTVGGYIASTFQPVLEKLGSFLKNTLVPAWNAISTAIGKIIDFLKEMADRINNLQLPWWLTPHSPTPFEVGLVGVGEAMQKLNAQMSVMVGGLNQTNFAGAGAGIPQSVHNSSTQNENINLFAPLIIQGNTPAGSLGARLKGRRY
jgi:hypothetical protein